MLARLQSLWKYSIPDLRSHPLWQRRQLTPMLRFFYLQALFGLGRKRLSLPWICDLLLPVERGDHGFTGNYYLGLHEFKDMAFALHLLRPDDLFVDVGSNMGSYSLLLAGCAGARCHAYEPVPATYQRLLDAIQLNHLSDRIVPRNLALSCSATQSKQDRLVFSADRGCANSFVDSSYPGRKIYVDVSTLDQQIAAENPILIKIDVEGFEERVLMGGADTLTSECLLAIIIEGQTAMVNALLSEAGFVDRGYLPLQRQLIPIVGYTPNRIWVKKARLGEVEERLRSAPVREVYGRKF